MQQDKHTKSGKVEYFESLLTYMHMYNPKRKKQAMRNEIEFGPYQHSTQ